MTTSRKRRKKAKAEKPNKPTTGPKPGTDPGFKNVRLKARTIGQHGYIKSIRDNDITFCTGPAGTGKTHVAIGMAIQMIREGFMERIIITRPLVGVGKDMGFLPGDIMDKVGPYVTPCFDELSYYMSISMIRSWQKEKIIDVVPLSMMRGRTFNNAFIILDEAQNATQIELKMLLTRLGESSRLVLSGDVRQSDLPHHEQGAFGEARERLCEVSGISDIQLTEVDIVRHRLIGQIARLLW